MSFKNITVIGGGILGSQIAYQSAYKGFHVRVYLRGEASIERAKPKFARWHKIYLEELEDAKAFAGTNHQVSRGLLPSLKDITTEQIETCKRQADAALQGMEYHTDLAEALMDADLVIESMAEDPAQKTAMYRQMAPLLPEQTILVTNSSTLLPSVFRDDTGRPERFLALHFANEIWRNNVAEIMGHDATSPECFRAVVEFAEQIGMIPLCLKKEQPGYLLNSMLVPLLNAAQSLLANEVADPETIDLAWTLGTGAPAGPFRILDVVGLTTAYNIVAMNPQASDRSTTPGKIEALLKKYLDEGKTGVTAGEGFYKYR